LRFGCGASIELFEILRPLLLQNHAPNPIKSSMKATTPRPTPTAAAVLNCVVVSRLESPGDPSGAESIRLVHLPFRHALSLAQSPPVAQVWTDIEDVLTLEICAESSIVGLGVGATVSSSMKLNCGSTLICSSNSFDDVVGDMVARCRVVGVSVLRILVVVVDIMIRKDRVWV
jgi:hypothetical protein